jgi:hypothetical protein
MGVRNSCEALPVKARTLANALSMRSSIWLRVLERSEISSGVGHGKARIEVTIVDEACLGSERGHWLQRLAAHQVPASAASRITAGVSKNSRCESMVNSAADLLSAMPVCTE